MRTCLAAFCFLALVAAGRIVSAQGLATAKPEEVGLSSERLARIRPAMQRYIDRNEIAGAVTLVARRGKVVHLEAAGMRDAEAKAPMATDAIFRIASMTKPITSVAAMMLWEEGRFLLTDPISKFLPEFKEMKVAIPAPRDERVVVPYKLVPAERSITIQQLFTHTAGLQNDYRGQLKDEYLKISAKQKPDETVGDFIQRLAKMPLNFQPGEAWEYSRATDVVGRLVEVVSGQTLDEFFRERIFKPLGMKDTHFYLPEDKLPRFAAQYAPDEAGKIRLAEAPNKESRFVKEPHVYFMGAGGLVSTAADYFRFAQAMLNGGELDGARILGRKTVELMASNHTGDLPIWLAGPGMGFGLGFAVVEERGPSALPWSEGSFLWGGAFCTYFWIDPQEELIGIIMTQVRPYDHLNIRQEFVALANQAIVDGPERLITEAAPEAPVRREPLSLKDAIEDLREFIRTLEKNRGR